MLKEKRGQDGSYISMYIIVQKIFLTFF